MKIKVLIELNITKEQLGELCKAEEIVGGWKAFIKREIEISGLDNMAFDYDIDAKILKIEEVD